MFSIKGYKTIKSTENFEPKAINVLIGPKSIFKFEKEYDSTYQG